VPVAVVAVARMPTVALAVPVVAAQVVTLILAAPSPQAGTAP